MNKTIRSLLQALLVTAVLAGSCIAAADTAVDELYRASYALEAKGDAPGALGKMRQVRAKSGKSYFVTTRVAWLAYLSGLHDESVQGYQEAIRMKPGSVEARLGLTLPLLAQSKWRELDRACREVLKLAPSNMLARARLAHALYSVGNYPDSATLYRKLIAEYPADLSFQTGLAWAVLKMGRRSEARAMFLKVLAVSPDNASAKSGLAAK